MAKTNKAQENRLALLEAGIEMFSRRGYGGVGLKELLSQVNVPKGSFYNYFDSKEDFAIQAVGHYSEIFLALIAAQTERRFGEVPARVANVLTVLIQYFEAKGFSDGCLVGDMSTELADTSESCRRALGRALEEMTQAFEALMQTGQEEGSIRRDMSAADLAAFVIDTWQGALIRMRVQKSGEALEKAKAAILQFIRPL